jgi:hypothetical protein
MTKLIVRFDTNNPCGLRLEDGSTPKSLVKGCVVNIENEADQRDAKMYGTLLVPLDCAAGQRALVESQFDREKVAKVKMLLKKLGAKTIAEARGTEYSGFLNESEKARPGLVELFELLRQAPPPPPRPSFIKELFKARK